ncbi:MAG TPA: hypothetical protein VGI86_02830 [Acidimicrobiia bacterium]
MPTYGDSKRLDMARSILPASARARKPARNHRARVHRAARAKARQQLAVAPFDDDFDADGEIGPDARRAPYGGTRALVQRRRAADNIGPFLRWATSHADESGDAPDARVAALRSVLPRGIIGAHAVSHLVREPMFKVGQSWSDVYDLRRAADLRACMQYRARLASELPRQIRANLDRVGELNRALKRVHHAEHAGGPPRFLLGAHDIDAFAEFVGSELRRATTYSERDAWRRRRAGVVLEFCGIASPPWPP